MAWSGNVKIHAVPGTGYPGQPDIYSAVTFGDVQRDGSTVFCDVSASLNAMNKYSYFGYYIKVYAQIDDGQLVQLYYKPNSPSRWNSGVYNGNGRVYATNTGSTATLSIWFESQCGGECWGAKSPHKMFSVTVSAPPMSPPNISVTNIGYNANSISWTGNTDVLCDQWFYSIDGQPWTAYSYASTTSTSFSLSVSPVIHTLWLNVHRVNGQWGQSNVLTYDCRIPNIDNAIINPTGVNSGSLSFYTDYDVNYYLNDVYLGTGKGDLSASVSLQSNSSKEYTLKVTRTENTQISNNKNINADTTYASINLVATVVGTSIQYDVSSNTPCKDWCLELTYTDKQGTPQKEIIRPTTSVNTKWTGSITDLDIDTIYTLQAFATKVSNNVFSSSNTNSVQPEACLHIIDNNNKPVIAVPYVYIIGRGWVKASPYIWKQNDTKWHVCI